MNKWMCPKCLASGCDNTQPLCDRCNYEIKMIEISDMFYNAYHHQRWLEREAARVSARGLATGL